MIDVVRRLFNLHAKDLLDKGTQALSKESSDKEMKSRG